MEITKPHYYDAFSCLAGACPDTCCANWEVVIDPESEAFYSQVSGALGQKLRDAMVEIEGERCFGLEKGLCKLLRPDGLCPIQAELGEEHLCKICAKYPRFSTEIGLRREIGLSLSCPEAARLILTNTKKLTLWKENTDEPMSSLHELSPALIITMHMLREKALEIVAEEAIPFSQKCVQLLRLCAPVAAAKRDRQLSAALTKGIEDAQHDSEVQSAGEAGVAHFQKALLELMDSMEVLSPVWQEQLHSALNQSLVPVDWTSLCPPLPGAWEQLLSYGIYKYFPRAVFDRNIWPTAVFCVLLPLLLRQLMSSSEDKSKERFLRLAWTLSREVEHSENNMASLFHAFSRRVFRPEALEAILSAI